MNRKKTLVAIILTVISIVSVMLLSMCTDKARETDSSEVRVDNLDEEVIIVPSLEGENSDEGEKPNVVRKDDAESAPEQDVEPVLESEDIATPEEESDRESKQNKVQEEVSEDMEITPSTKPGGETVEDSAVQKGDAEPIPEQDDEPAPEQGAESSPEQSEEPEYEMEMGEMELPFVPAE